MRGRPVAVVLPGGGALGYRQVGALRAIQDSGQFEVKAVAGCSVGTLIGSLYAQEQSVDLIEDIFLNHVRKTSDIYRSYFPFGMIQGMLFNRGLYSAAPLRRLIQKYLNVDKLIQSPIKFSLVTCNLNTAEIETYSNIPEHRSVLAGHVYSSAAYPVFFETHKLGSVEYWDGGLREQAPIMTMRRMLSLYSIEVERIFVVMNDRLEWPIVDRFRNNKDRISRVISILTGNVLWDDVQGHVKSDVSYIFPEPQMVKDSLNFDQSNTLPGYHEGLETMTNYLGAL